MAAPSPDNSREMLQEIYSHQIETAERESRQSWEQSLATCLRAIREEPNSAKLYKDAAQCYRKLKNHEAAIAILAEGIGHCAFDAGLHRWNVNLLEQCNRTREAIAAAREALLVAPDDVLLKFKEALLLPILYESTAEVDRYRQRFAEGLERLSRELRLDTTEEKHRALFAVGSHVNVQLGYQARNDRDLQKRYGDFVHRIMAANFPQWVKPIAMPPAPPSSALRVGYISSRFRNLSATKYFLGWIREHNPEKFAVYAYHVGRKTDTTTQEVRRASRYFRQLSNSLEEACQDIRGDQLHVLVFWDVGIDPVMTQLAALRLGAIQCAAWDQPVTTGLPTVDYFLSGDLAEPREARDHYSEALVRLPGTGTCFAKPVIPRVLLNKTRQDFRLREDAIVYLCCQYAFKYLPRQDECLARIAKRVPNSQFVFVTPNEFVARDFRDRLERAFSAEGLCSGDYCVLLPELERFSYWNLCLVGDVVLDTFDWSGGVSTFEAIACRQPVVTLPGEFMRGRQSYAILTQLGVHETIARDEQDYVAISVRLGLDRSWRNSIAEKMATNLSKIFSDRMPVTGLEDFYSRAIEMRSETLSNASDGKLQRV